MNDEDEVQLGVAAAGLDAAWIAWLTTYPQGDPRLFLAALIGLSGRLLSSLYAHAGPDGQRAVDIFLDGVRAEFLTLFSEASHDPDDGDADGR